MAKQNKKTETELEAALENDEPEKDTMRELSPEEKTAVRIASDGAGIPGVEYIRDLFFKMRGEIPKQIRIAYKDRAYCWQTFETMKEEHHQAGGIWEYVTAGNHMQVDNRSLFDVTGLVTKKGNMVLAWTRRELCDEIDQITTRKFNFKVQNQENPNDRVYKHPHSGKEAGRIVATNDVGRPGFDLDRDMKTGAIDPDKIPDYVES